MVLLNRGIQHWLHLYWIFPYRFFPDRRGRLCRFLRPLQNGVLDGAKLPVLVADARPDEIAVCLQLPDPAADAVDAALADAGKPLHGVVPVLWQRQHEGQQPLRFQGQRPVPQVVVGHDRVISGLFDAENCHIRRLLSLVLKSVDFGAKKPLSCLSDASHGKIPTPPFKRRSERKKQRFSRPN